MTKKRNLATAVLLLTALAVHAQQPMYVCTTSGCDAFDMALMPSAVFAGDSIRIGHQPAYHVQQIDSIVFRRPQGEVHELGWWGSMTDGTACYRARLEQPDYQYDACYTFHVEAGICTSAECELCFAEQWMLTKFLQFGEMPTDTDTNDAYIYVKATQTGPRRFEVWVMGNPVLPFGGEWLIEGNTLTVNCNEWLAGRTMSEVRQIVEAWVHQQATVIELPKDPYDDEQN